MLYYDVNSGNVELVLCNYLSTDDDATSTKVKLKQMAISNTKPLDTSIDELIR